MPYHDILFSKSSIFLTGFRQLYVDNFTKTRNSFDTNHYISNTIALKLRQNFVRTLFVKFTCLHEQNKDLMAIYNSSTILVLHIVLFLAIWEVSLEQTSKERSITLLASLIFRLI